MNTRTLLLLLLAFLGFMLYTEWQSQFGPQPPAPVESLPDAEPRAQADPADDLPELPDLPDSGQESSPSVTAADPAVPSAAASSSEWIEVHTDRVRARIDPVGGSLVGLELIRYPVSIDRPDQPYALLKPELPDLQIAQAGLIDADRRAPNHTTRYSHDQQEYILADDRDELIVPLYWSDGNGLEVIQSWVFRRGEYRIEHRVEVVNNGSQEWRGSRYLRLVRVPTAASNGLALTNPERISYDGAAVYSAEDKFNKLPFDEFDEQVYRNTITGGWAAMVQHYFLTAWIPPAEQPHQYTTGLLDQSGMARYALTVTSAPIAVDAGQSRSWQAELFAGPKRQNRLEQVAPGLELTVDYGIFTVFSKPLFWLLEHIHTLVRNWGLAIVLLTILIKLAFYKLTQAQFRSMGKLRKLQPRIEQLKERYGDDRQKFGQAMMEIYKTEKVNPLGGCLPILVQIPIFIALYWVLLESVELRQAGFLWIPDLSKPDPLFILPVINGAFMIITQRLTPAAGMDPMQRKIMQYLPVAFAVLFAFFPAGLVLYWATNSGTSLAQQWHILRQLDAEDQRVRR